MILYYIFCGLDFEKQTMWQSLSDIHCNLAQSFQNADYSLLSADPLNSCSLILNRA